MILTDKMWNEEAGKVYDKEPMLSWEACEMIAWNNLTKRYGEVDYENHNWEIP